MSHRRSSFPGIRRHKPSNRTVVTIRLADGRRKDVPGKWKSAAATREYNRVIAELATSGAMPFPEARSDITIAELLAR